MIVCLGFIITFDFFGSVVKFGHAGEGALVADLN